MKMSSFLVQTSILTAGGYEQFHTLAHNAIYSAGSPDHSEERIASIFSPCCNAYSSTSKIKAKCSSKTSIHF
jgi:hypothetical protein